jgi:tRNA A-37 threonylcarbamoyl transferase component Bud32
MFLEIFNILASKIKNDLGLTEVVMDELFDGFVHCVYKIKNKHNFFILKIRGDHFKNNSAISIDSKQISFEATVLKALEDSGMINFPKLIKFYRKESAMLIENIGGKSNNFLFLLNNNVFKIRDYFKIAEFISKLLIKLNRESINVSAVAVENNFVSNIVYRINRHKLNHFFSLEKRINNLNKYFICGDLSPKNIFYFKNDVKICDLENFQKAPIEFDVYYLLAHIILHNLYRDNLFKIIDNFEKGLKIIKDKMQFTDQEIMIYCLSVMLYRLDNDEIKYELFNLSNNQKNKLLLKIYFILSNQTKFNNLNQSLRYLINEETNELETKILEVNQDKIIRLLIKNNSKKIFDNITTIETFEAPFYHPAPFVNNKLDELIRHLSIITDNFTKSLDSMGAYMRIREENKEYELTLKYHIEKGGVNYKMEREINVFIDSKEFLGEIKDWLIKNKFTNVSYEIKQRISFINRIHGTRIDIDNWQKPSLPTYLEIEGFDKNSINDTCKMLGFDIKDLSSISGKELFKRYKVKRGI